MNEFKGTKGRLAVKEAIGPRNELLYYYVQHKGNSIADFCPNPYTEIPTTMECAKANAVLYSKAPEMLEALITIRRRYNIQPDFEKEIDQLIKEATEI